MRGDGGFTELINGTRWCKYCSSRQAAEVFVKVFTRAPRRLVGYKCTQCSAAAKLSVAERDERARKMKLKAEETSVVKSQILRDEMERKRTEKRREQI